MIYKFILTLSRLASLGFLYLGAGEGRVPGNAGLLDQVMMMMMMMTLMLMMTR